MSHMPLEGRWFRRNVRTERSYRRLKPRPRHYYSGGAVKFYTGESWGVVHEISNMHDVHGNMITFSLSHPRPWDKWFTCRMCDERRALPLVSAKFRFPTHSRKSVILFLLMSNEPIPFNTILYIRVCVYERLHIPKITTYSPWTLNVYPLLKKSVVCEVISCHVFTSNSIGSAALRNDEGFHTYIIAVYCYRVSWKSWL